MKHAQLICGPAGAGKSTYCSVIHKHCHTVGRAVHVVNLDPAAEHFDYPVAIDIRDLIGLEDAMEEMQFGPNGGLVFCMEYLISHLDWLEEQISRCGEDYILFDCPGQIELYSHLPVMKTLTKNLQDWGYNVCGVYCVDSLVVSDANRFIAGTLLCLSAMIHLELPHINVLTKCDRITDKKKLEHFLDPSARDIINELNDANKNKNRLNEELGQLIQDYSMVSFLPLNIKDEESISYVLAHIDHAIQYGEDEEVQEVKQKESQDGDLQAKFG
jgi:GTPase SAR1 family protein